MSNLHSYPSIYNLGHKAVREIFSHPFRVQEKVDGSQFSFALIDGQLRTRSKGQEFAPEYPPDMFKLACEQVMDRKKLLHPGWIYRGEYLNKPKHNALEYGRVPLGNVILFDIDRGVEDYLDQDELNEEANRLNLECVPLYTLPTPVDAEMLHQLLDTPSCLGSKYIEGFVIKSCALYGSDKKTLMAKHVSERFKEVHSTITYGAGARKIGITQLLIERYKNPNRWLKAIQHLREAGMIQDAPQDIGPLIKEIPKDIEKECKEEIMIELYKHIWPDIARGCVAGFPEWYKDQLLERQFANET